MHHRVNQMPPQGNGHPAAVIPIIKICSVVPILIELAFGRRSQPEIVIYPGRRWRVLDFLQLPIARIVIDLIVPGVPAMHERDFAELARANNFLRLQKECVGVLLKAERNGGVWVWGGWSEKLAFGVSVTDGFFQISVFARLRGLNRRNRVPVVGGGDDNSVHILAVEDAAEIAGRLHPAADALRGFVKLGLIYIAERDGFCLRRFQTFLQIEYALATATDQRQPDCVVRAKRTGAGQRETSSRALHELSSCEGSRFAHSKTSVASVFRRRASARTATPDSIRPRPRRRTRS